VARVTGAPHIAFPVRLAAGGQLETVEEDSLDEVAQAVYWLASTEPKSVPDLPDAGIPSPVFVRGDTEVAIADELREQEPRATVTAIRHSLSEIELDVSLSTDQGLTA
jgi:hypothetical protein